MRCLMVISHPLTNSLCQYLAGHVADRLHDMGHEVTIEDLYAENFDPALAAVERASYYEGAYDSAGAAEQVDRLLRVDALVLLFPTWWFGFPAVLKGWFDRVWGPGIAYDHADNYGPIKPRLHNLKRVLVVTSLGSPWWVDRLVMRQPVKRIVQRALLGTCTSNSKLQFLSLYNSEKLNERDVARFKTRIDRAVNAWK